MDSHYYQPGVLCGGDDIIYAASEKVSFLPGDFLYFLFEGAWTLFNTLVSAIWPYADFMIWVHHVGIILFAGYLFYKIYVYYWRQKRMKKGAGIGGKG